MKLSIIIPLFNCEKFISECLNSLNQLNAENVEIIVINDGSTDNSLQVAESYSDKFQNFKVHSQENAGLSVARNEGLKLASGEFIFFCDSDDYVDAAELKRALDYAKEHQLDILEGNGKNLKKGQITSNLKKDAFKRELSIVSGPQYYLDTNEHNEFSINVVTKLYKRSFLSEHGLKNYPGLMHEDEEFTPRAYAVAKKVGYTPAYFYIRRHRIGSITKNEKHKYINSKSSPSFIKILESFENELSRSSTSELKAVFQHAIHKCYLEIIKRELFYKRRGHSELALSSQSIMMAKTIAKNAKLPLNYKFKIWRYELKFKLTKAKT